MPTFIDESGDLGAAGSRFFRLCAVWFPTAADVEAFRQAVGEVRRESGLPSDYEFKFHATYNRPAYRSAFFAAAMRSPFRFAVSSVDKQSPEWRDAGRRGLLRVSVGDLSASIWPTLRLQDGGRGRLRDPVLIDDNRDPDLLGLVKEMFRAMRTEGGSPGLVGKVAFASSNDAAIQLADMVCGSVAAALDLDGVSSWYDLIRSRKLYVTSIP